MARKPSANNPSSTFYWKDYENDEGLRVSSLAAQGLWMRLMCVAAKSDPYGYVLINGCEIGVTGVARLGSVSETEAATLLDELERNGVFSRDRKGRIFSRRMVRESATRKKAKENGKKGGNPALTTSNGNKRENQGPVNQPHNPGGSPLTHYPYPSSSSEEDSDTAADAAREARDGDPRADPPTFRERILKAIGADPVSGLTGPAGKVIGTQADMAVARRWLALPGLTEDAIIAEIRAISARRRGGKLPSTFGYFSGAMEDLSGALTAPALSPTARQPQGISSVSGHPAAPRRPRINPDDYDEKGNRIRPAKHLT